jgi:TatD DNase family protein
VLAVTLSLAEAAHAVRLETPSIVWGVGCHPRIPKAVASFNRDWFAQLLPQTPLVGEVGLDQGSKVPLEQQLRVFRQVLETVVETPRLVSIHSYQATQLVLDELRRNPIRTPILHGWTGSATETRQAVALGCYFSIHSQVARSSKFRLHVPLERVLVESDHGWNDPPDAIPYRIRWVEYLVAQQYKLEVDELRRQVWQNMQKLVEETGVAGMMKEFFAPLC